MYTGVAYQDNIEYRQVTVLRIYGKTWKWLSSNDQQPIWQSLKNFEKNNGQMLYNPGVQSS